MNKMTQLISTVLMILAAQVTLAETVSLNEAQAVLAKGIGYQRALSQLKMATSIPVNVGYSSKQTVNSDGYIKYAVNYFYAGTNEVCGTLEVETRVNDHGDILQVGTVEFIQLQ